MSNGTKPGTAVKSYVPTCLLKSRCSPFPDYCVLPWKSRKPDFHSNHHPCPERYSIQIVCKLFVLYVPSVYSLHPSSVHECACHCVCLCSKGSNCDFTLRPVGVLLSIPHGAGHCKCCQWLYTSHTQALLTVLLSRDCLILKETPLFSLPYLLSVTVVFFFFSSRTP